LTKKKKGNSKIWAFVAVFFGFIGLTIAYIFKRDDKYVLYYIKQSMILFIARVVTNVIGWLFGATFTGLLVGAVLGVTLLVLWVITLVNSLSGEMKETPLIGSFAKYL